MCSICTAWSSSEAWLVKLTLHVRIVLPTLASNEQLFLNHADGNLSLLEIHSKPHMEIVFDHKKGWARMPQHFLSKWYVLELSCHCGRGAPSYPPGNPHTNITSDTDIYLTFVSFILGLLDKFWWRCDVFVSKVFFISFGGILRCSYCSIEF